jgi:hypothetical protein
MNQQHVKLTANSGGSDTLIKLRIFVAPPKIRSLPFWFTHIFRTSIQHQVSGESTHTQLRLKLLHDLDLAPARCGHGSALRRR